MSVSFGRIQINKDEGFQCVSQYESKSGHCPANGFQFRHIDQQTDQMTCQLV